MIVQSGQFGSIGGFSGSFGSIGVGSSDTVKLTCQGEVDGTVVPVSVVVWNPHEAKAASMGDFGNDQYNDMICVEPGLLRGDTLQPGKQATMTQTIG